MPVLGLFKECDWCCIKEMQNTKHLAKWKMNLLSTGDTFWFKSFQFVKEGSCLSQQSHHGLNKASLSHQYTGEVRSYRTTVYRTPGQSDSGYELLSEVSKPTVTMAEFRSFGDYLCISASSGPKQRTWSDRHVCAFSAKGPPCCLLVRWHAGL